MRRVQRAVFVAWVQWSAVSLGAQIAVTTADDELNTDGDCSLREAIQAANDNAAVDGCAAGEAEPAIDVVSLPAGTFLLGGAADEDVNASGDLDITSSLTLVGAGAGLTLLSAAGQDRLIHALGSAPLRVEALSLSGGGGVTHGGCLRAAGAITLQSVAVLRCATVGATSVFGGALYASGAVTIERSRFEKNRGQIAADQTGNVRGGAVYAAGTITIRDSLFRGNEVMHEGTSGGASGGALFTDGVVLVERTWFDQNVAAAPGTPAATCGAANLHGGTVRDSTFSDNTSENATVAINFVAEVRGATFFGNVTTTGTSALLLVRGTALERSTFVGNSGGNTFWSAAGTTTLRNNLFSGNSGGSTDVDGVLASGGHNWVQRPGPLVADGTDTTGVAAAVLPLGLNSGPVPTVALAIDSDAVDLGACTDLGGATVPRDVRGLPRPVGGGCDIGAYERQSTGAATAEQLEPPGANCPEGGTRIDLGVDLDGDGILSREELFSSEYVCGTPPAALSSALEPAGANCATGGVRVELGTDADRDGVLHTSEVESVRYFCHPTLLIVSAAEPAGSICALGGTRIDSGLDDDQDGTLDAEEVEASTAVCVGAVLSTATPEPPGGSCPLGGERIDAGIDDDADGVLSAAEVDSTRYVCRAQVLSTSSAEPAGAACEHGGTRVESGIDADGDGLLDTAEVGSVQVNCHPAPVSCELSENEDGTVTQTCTDGSSETAGTPRGCSAVPSLVPVGALLLLLASARRRRG